MLPWAIKRLSPHQTAMAMIGVRPGQRVVFLGAGAAALAGDVAAVAGLNGHLVVVDNTASAARQVAAGAATAGALVEFQSGSPAQVPLGNASFDLAVIANRLASLPAPDQQGCAREARRLVRPGGRVTVIDGAQRSGLLASFRPGAGCVGADRIRALLVEAGWKATRVLAQSEGVTYVEGM